MKEIFNLIIKDLKNDDVVKKMCAKHGVNIEWLNYVPIKFGDISVSAKTDHGVIIINKKFLNEKDNYFEISQYIVHELVHWLQQSFGDEGTQSSNDGNYLDNEFEQEAFQNQVKFLSDNKSESCAEDYVENLLEHHNVPNKEKKEKKDVLLSKI